MVTQGTLLAEVGTTPMTVGREGYFSLRRDHGDVMDGLEIGRERR